MNKKLLYKIIGILLLIIGIIFIVFALVDFVKVMMYNKDLLPSETGITTNIWYSVAATPLMFGGFFFIILGFGTKKEYVQK